MTLVARRSQLMHSRRGTRIALLAATLVTLHGTPASAHRGPPFPVLVDHQLARFPYVLSVWADPDIGDARFFLILEPRADISAPAPVPLLSFWVEPTSGRLARASYPAERESLRGRIQFSARPFFDQRDLWRVGIELAQPGGSPETVTLEIESTPPGLGAWDLVLYVFPFLLFGGLWAKALLGRRANARGVSRTR